MRSGFIGVIGKANAGKSTLINVLVGEKISIVSPKPQTTRDAVMGILTKEDYQLVFVDTPGIYKSKTYLTDVMMKTTETAAKGVDVILFVHDGHAGVSESDTELMKKYMIKNFRRFLLMLVLEISRCYLLVMIMFMFLYIVKMIYLS